jgi:hypothetical protein
LCSLIAGERLGRVESRRELLGLGGAQGLKSEDWLKAIRMPFLQNLRPRETDEQDRSAVAYVENVLDEI